MAQVSAVKPVKLCACGCGLPVKRGSKTWLGGHVPRELRSLGGSKGRASYAFQRRRKRFEAAFTALTRDGRLLTKEAILDAFAEIERAAYHRGYKACETKLTGRKWWKRPTAA